MINKDSSLSLDKICRSCMAETNQMRSVYDTNTESIQLAEMIMACASVQVILCIYFIYYLLADVWGGGGNVCYQHVLSLYNVHYNIH